MQPSFPGRRAAAIALGFMLAFGVSACPSQPKEEAPSHHEESEGHDHEETDAHAGLIELSEAAQRQIGLEVAPARTRELPEVLTAPGQVEANANREAHVTTRVAGRVSAIYKNVGDTIQAGTPLAQLDSVVLGEAQSAYLEALARASLIRTNADRLRRLYRDELVAQKEVLGAESEERLAAIALERARAQLTLYGMTPERIARLGATRRLDPSLTLAAPLAGVVMARELTLGEMLEPNTPQPAFLISDVSELWVTATLYERDLARVRVGQTARITVPALPGVTLVGKVSLVSTALDPKSRTAKARVVVSNRNGRLRPDMTAEVAIALGTQARLAVPEEAVVREKEEASVFVRRTPETFERRPVTLGKASEGWVAVTSGLSAREPVVVRGAFNLKAEQAKESFGHEH